MATVTIPFTLDDQADRDIIAWLDRQPKRQRSAAIRDALHAYVSDRVTLADVYQAVQELDRKLSSGAIFVGGGGASDPEDAEEPPDVAAALDNLGL